MIVPYLVKWLSRKNSAQQFTGSGARCTQNRSECIFFLTDACSPLQTSSDVLATPFQEMCLIAEHYFCGRAILPGTGQSLITNKTKWLYLSSNFVESAIIYTASMRSTLLTKIIGSIERSFLMVIGTKNHKPILCQSRKSSVC